jgi:homoserine dehydrogenase
MSPVNVAVLGAGTVGSGTIDLLLTKRSRLAAINGTEIVPRHVLVRDLGKRRPVAIPAELLTTDPRRALDDPDVQVVVELIGGEEPARSYIEAALESGRHVVTANKEVIAKHGGELLRLADRKGVDLCFEASVGGGIPIIDTLRKDLIANDISAIRAIINGTSNYILTAMAAGREYSDALRQAQELGYAEADPRADVEGIDALYKLSILATLAFRTDVRPSDLTNRGITTLAAKDFQYAAEMGYVVRLIAWARKDGAQVEGAVYPMMISRDHQLAAVKGVFNAVMLEGDQIDQLTLYGRGAGAKPTASAVVADLCRVAQNIRNGVSDRIHIGERALAVRPFEKMLARFYLRLSVVDRPGVLARIAHCLGSHQISISSVIQRETDETSRVAELVIMTHAALEGQMARAIESIAALDVVREVASFVRVER